MSTHLCQQSNCMLELKEFSLALPCTFMGYKKDDKKDKLDCILYISKTH